MTDDQLRGDAEDELRWEPKIDNEAIAVSAKDGVVTLRGTVGSFRERRQATSAVKRVYGTKTVDNQLQVRLLDDDRREDSELRGAVLQALMLDSMVPSTVDAKVDDGVVTLTGTANFQYERDEAEYVVGNILGVAWVDDEIALTVPPPSNGDVERSIRDALERNARLDAGGVQVDSGSDGLVRLSGRVRSWAEHDAAVDAAWSAPGVSTVDDDILVAY